MYNIYDVLNEVINYIEEHILENINIKQLSKIAGLNEIYLKSLFSCLSGVGISEYIRLRRLSLSVNDILNGENITNVAYKYLYNSISSYNRAFKKYIGITPRDLKKGNRKLTMFNKIIFNEIVNNYNVNYKIYKNKSFDLFYISKKINHENYSKEISNFWEDVKHNYSEFTENIRYGFLDKTNKDNMVYYCLLKNNFKNSKEIEINKCNYFAIEIKSFESKNIISNINKAINEYIKSLNYKLLNKPRIEIYYKDYMEILIPIT